MRAPSMATVRRLAPFVLVPLAAVGLLAYARSKPIAVRTEPVTRGLVVREAIGTGTLESEVVLEVAFTIAGRLAEVRFHEGDRVHAGDVLAILDAQRESQRVAVARRNVAIASHGVTRSAADVLRAQATLEAATTELRRTEQLLAGGASTEAAIDAARERMAHAEAELAAATASRLVGTSNLSMARASLELDASLVDETVVRSPLDGVVVHRRLEPGAVLAPGEVVLTIASTELVWARVWLDETALHELGLGQPAFVTFRGRDAVRYRARVDRIGIEADRETHEVLVDLELLERPGRLVFGQRLDGFVELERRENVLRIRRGVCEESRRRCPLVRDGRIVESDVRLGLVGTDFVELLGDATADARFIVPREDGTPHSVGRRARETRR